MPDKIATTIEAEGTKAAQAAQANTGNLSRADQEPGDTLKMEQSKPFDAQVREQNIQDMQALRTPQVIRSLESALSVYYYELVTLGYSPLTVGTYCSDVGRFIQFLKDGDKQKARTQ